MLSATLPIPRYCPACRHELVIRMPHLICGNVNCVEKLKGLLVHAGKRSNLDIVGLADEVAEALVESRLVEYLSDLWELDERELAAMPFGRGQYGNVRAKKLHEAIQSSRAKLWPTVLHSLGCPGLGGPECDKIAVKYSLQRLLATPTGQLKQELMIIPGIGQVTAVDFCEWLRLSNGWLSRLSQFLQTEPLRQDPSRQPLLGLTIVVTGGFDQPRPKIEAALKSLGATVTGSVSKNTSLLVTGHDPGKNKTDAAAKFGVRVVGPEELAELLAGKPGI